MSDKEFTPTEPIMLDQGAAPNGAATEGAAPNGPAPEGTAPNSGATDKPPTASDAAASPPTAAAQAAGAPTQAAHNGSRIDDRAYQQYQSLAQVVLDSADIATKSTEAAAAASSDLHKATSDFKALTESGHKKAIILLGVTGGVLLFCLVFFLAMGVRMNSRINQLDTMMLAVGKRVVDLNVGLESLDTINRSIEGLTAQQVEQAKSQGQIEGRINEALKKSETMVQTVPGETAKQVAATSDNLAKQVQGMNSRLQSQANAVQTLGNEVKALKGAVGNVDKLNQDVQALVTLQRERFLETLQKSSATTNRERAVQYPRANPAAGPASAAAGAPNSAGSTPPASAPR